MSGNIPRDLVDAIKQAIREADTLARGKGKTVMPNVRDENVIAYINQATDSQFRESRRVLNIKLEPRKLKMLRARLGREKMVGKRGRSASTAKPPTGRTKRTKAELTREQQRRAGLVQQMGQAGGARAQAQYKAAQAQIQAASADLEKMKQEKLARQTIVPGSPKRDKDAILRARRQTGYRPPSGPSPGFGPFQQTPQPTRSHVIGGTARGLHTGPRGYGGRGQPMTAQGLQTGQRGFGGRGQPVRQTMSPIDETHIQNAARQSGSHPLDREVNKGSVPDQYQEAENIFSGGNVELRAPDSIRGENFTAQRNRQRAYSTASSLAPSVIGFAEGLGVNIDETREPGEIGKLARADLREAKRGQDEFEDKLRRERGLQDVMFERQHKEYYADLADKEARGVLKPPTERKAVYRPAQDVTEDPEVKVTEGTVYGGSPRISPSEAPTVQLPASPQEPTRETQHMPSLRTEMSEVTTDTERLDREATDWAQGGGEQDIPRPKKEDSIEDAIRAGQAATQDLPTFPIPTHTQMDTERTGMTETTIDTARLDQEAEEAHLRGRFGDLGAGMNPPPAQGREEVPRVPVRSKDPPFHKAWEQLMRKVGNDPQGDADLADLRRLRAQGENPDRLYFKEWTDFLRDVEHRISTGDLDEGTVDRATLNYLRSIGRNPAGIREEDWITDITQRTEEQDPMSVDRFPDPDPDPGRGPNPFTQYRAPVTAHFTTPKEDRRRRPTRRRDPDAEKGERDQQIREELRARDERGDRDRFVNPAFRGAKYEELQALLKPDVMGGAEEEALGAQFGDLSLGRVEEKRSVPGPTGATMAHKSGTGAEELDILRREVGGFRGDLGEVKGDLAKIHERLTKNPQEYKHGPRHEEHTERTERTERSGIQDEWGRMDRASTLGLTANIFI